VSRFRVWVLILISVLLAWKPSVAEDGASSANVARALEAGRVKLLEHLQNPRRSIGYRCLTVLAAINAGASTTDPVVAAALESIIGESERIHSDYGGSYEAGGVSMVMALLKGPRAKRVAEQMEVKLEHLQGRDGGWGDNSRTQFALLGLNAATELGVEVPSSVFASAETYLERGQNPDGSWGYHPQEAGHGSMTAAGISGLYIVREQQRKTSKACGAALDDKRIRKGLEWLGGHFSVTDNPRLPGQHHFYWLYTVERIGVLLGQKYIGTHDWYREGAEYLLKTQTADGSWAEEPESDTEFALLFLGKGKAPVVMQKLDYGGDWNPDGYDARNLAEQASRDLNLPMVSRVVSATAADGEFAAAPVLYMQGRQRFEFEPRTRAAIRRFVEQGGFVFGSACCGRFSGFDQSFHSEMREIFPDGKFERLPLSHEIYSCRHRIENPSACPLEGLTSGCRTAVFYSPHDICCAWGGCRGCLDHEALSGDDARNLGVNLIVYAMGFQAMRDPLEAPAPAGGSTANPRVTLTIGQLYHMGEWNPDPASLPNLIKTLNAQSGATLEFRKKQATPGMDDLSECPLLYITGHRNFEYAPSAIDALREYLDRGGFLFGDACCGRPEFDAAFRKLCAELYPGRPLKQIDANHPVLQEPFAITRVEYKPAIKMLFPALGDKPYLEGISNADGRLIVLYSRINLGCELQGHPCAACVGVQGKDAYRIAVNAVMYALSH
jgi:hypothetical protein